MVSLAWFFNSKPNRVYPYAGQRKETKKKKHSEDEEEDPVQKMANED